MIRKQAAKNNLAAAINHDELLTDARSEPLAVRATKTGDCSAREPSPVFLCLHRRNTYVHLDAAALLPAESLIAARQNARRNFFFKLFGCFGLFLLLLIGAIALLLHFLKR
jgi:hypothetical protein